MMKKKKIRKDGHNYYLLGVDKDGISYYLKEGEWACGWYWCFDTIDIPDGWTHFNTLFGRDESGHPVNLYDGFVDRMVKSPLYQPGESKIGHTSLWYICDLMASFYALKEAADVLGRGNSHYTEGTPLNDIIKDEAYTKHLNEDVLPAIIHKVEEILTPEE